MKLTAVILIALIACAYALPNYKKKQPEDKALLGGIFCDTCKSLVQMAEAAGAGFGAPWLKAQIDNLCKELGIFKQFCVEELDKLVDDLVNLINQGLPPLVCCQKVGLCD